MRFFHTVPNKSRRHPANAGRFPLHPVGAAYFGRCGSTGRFLALSRNVEKSRRPPGAFSTQVGYLHSARRCARKSAKTRHDRGEHRKSHPPKDIQEYREIIAVPDLVFERIPVERAMFIGGASGMYRSRGGGGTRRGRRACPQNQAARALVQFRNVSRAV